MELLHLFLNLSSKLFFCSSFYPSELEPNHFSSALSIMQASSSSIFYTCLCSFRESQIIASPLQPWASLWALYQLDQLASSQSYFMLESNHFSSALSSMQASSSSISFRIKSLPLHNLELASELATYLSAISCKRCLLLVCSLEILMTLVILFTT